MLSLARALHVLGVLWWVGGVAMVTASIVPALRQADLTDEERRRIFGKIRARFVWQARAAVLLVGATGAYLLTYLGGIARLRSLAVGWWIDLMILTWAVFALLLFVLEPLGIMQKTGIGRRPRAFLIMHAGLLALALAAVASGVIWAHGGIY
ncbi:MAG TPA: hypothetical protein VIN61_13375 [Gammaproteobacteria bacterium]